MFSTEIRHFGTVVSVRDNVAQVRFLDTSREGCPGCGMSSFCGSPALVDALVPGRFEGQLTAGTKVVLRSAGGAGMSATMRLVVLPLTVFILVLVVALQIGFPELISAGLALVAVMLVFAGVHLYSRGHGLLWTVAEIEGK